MPKAATSRAGWTTVAFGDVVRLSTERSSNPESDGFERFVGLEHIEPGDLRIRRWGDIADGTTFTSVFRPGQVLFGKRRAYQRKVAVADFSGVCSGDIYILEPKGKDLLPELLPFICQTDAFFEHAVGTSAGSLSPRTNWTSLSGFEFALPPIEEQRRIAALLRVALDLCDKLQNTRSAANAAKQSFLYDLFGCADSGAQVCGHISAPSHWQPMHLPDLVVDQPNAITAGPFGTIFKAKDFRQAGIPIIQLRHLTDEGVILDKLTYMDVDVYERLHKPYTVRPGDLVLTKMGEPPGLAAIYPVDAPEGMVTPDVIKATLDDSTILPRFAVAMLNNARSRSNLRQLCKGGTRTRVSLDELYTLKWPIPPLDEQLRILRILDRCDSCASELSNRIKSVSRMSAAAIAGVGIGEPL
jgi:type I restriction enzyme S subunit